MLDLAAHCAPGEPIPLDLLRRAVADATDDRRQTMDDGKKKTEDEGQTLNADELPLTNKELIVHRPSPALSAVEGSIVNLTDAALHRLVTVGLARYADEGRALIVHRLVAAYVRREQQDADAMADVLADVLSSMTREVDLPSEMRPLLPHARHAAKAADARGSEYTAKLLNNIGQCFQELADLNTAQALLERARIILEAQLGPEHPDVAMTLNNLGGVAQAQGDFPAARALLDRALAIWEAQLGPEHPQVAAALNNLGAVAQAQGDLAAARALFERALAD